MNGFTVKKSDLDRICCISPPSRSEITQPVISDSDRQKASIARVKMWSNTVEAEQDRRNQETIKQRERAEAERCRHDLEEQIRKLDERQTVIAQATEKIAAESDRMKTFASAMKLSSVLAEREGQLKEKDQLAANAREEDIQAFRQMRANQADMLEREMLEGEAARNKKLLTAKLQKEQLEMVKAVRISSLLEDKAEGEHIRRRNEEFMRDEFEQKRAEREKAIRAQKDTMEAQKYLHELKQREADRCQREEQHITEYAIKKEALMAQRRASQEKVKLEKLAIRQRMIDAQAVPLARIRDSEDERIIAQCERTDEENKRKEAERLDRLSRWKAEMSENRKHQLERKRDDFRRRTEDEKKAAEYTALVLNRLEVDELEERNRRREEAQSHLRDLARQIQINAAKASGERAGNSDLVMRATASSQEADEEFDSFAEKIIMEYAEAGRNIIPLVKALHIQDK